MVIMYESLNHSQMIQDVFLGMGKAKLKSEQKGFIFVNTSKGRIWLKSLNEIFSAKQDGCRSLSSAYFIQQAQACILYLQSHFLVLGS